MDISIEHKIKKFKRRVYYNFQAEWYKSFILSITDTTYFENTIRIKSFAGLNGLKKNEYLFGKSSKTESFESNSFLTKLNLESFVLLC